MINFNQPDFSKFPMGIEKMNVNELFTLLEGIRNDFQPLKDEKGNIIKEFEFSLKAKYLDLCNYMYDQRFQIITKYGLEAEVYRYPEVSEIILTELINLKSGNVGLNDNTNNIADNDTI